jgi:hypothetical protein
MTITLWAACAAAIAADHISKEQLPSRVIALGWSLGGRLARDITLSLRNRGINLEIFVGLSAAPPIPGFGGLVPSDLKLAPSGLLDGSSPGSSIFKGREAHLAVMDKINGRVVLQRDAYARFYVTNSQINFRGEAERYQNHGLVTDIAASIADQGTFDFAGYPLCGAVAASSPLDMIHALTDSSVFGMLNAQALFHQTILPSLAGQLPTADQAPREPDPHKWAQLRQLMAGLTARLSRHVEGSHFFFLGQPGASATARYIQDLAQEAGAIRRELSALLA